eukprot:TRINITY_DN9589_c0_g1_i2.p1 TRINITY_DN9589_c0_g1~~TRINITY_DN9589_c0_g1_i2.p1  ORF type:complete len:356 (-),score=65.95 TRINITY_DN9589_c0_g1_i2:39-1106(-)
MLEPDLEPFNAGQDAEENPRELGRRSRSVALALAACAAAAAATALVFLSPRTLSGSAVSRPVESTISLDSLPAACSQQGMYFAEPIDLLGTSRSIEPSAAACRVRCGLHSSCEHFTWWPDGGCHLTGKESTLKKAIFGGKLQDAVAEFMECANLPPADEVVRFLPPTMSPPTEILMRGPLPSDTRMSEDFHSWTDLQSATGIQGVPWSELQRRCEPGAGPGQTYYGWIDRGTNLLDVLREDWETVKQLKTTHLELAAHLDAIYQQGSGPVTLQLHCTHTRGLQEDLIAPDTFFLGWNMDWRIKSGGFEFHIGGPDSSAGLVKYIKEFGFYEGGDSNSYRVDPAKLVAMLTGKQQS